MLIWFHLCTLLNIQNNIHSRSKKNWISKVYLNIRVEIVNRKKKKELLFYLNILALLKIRLEVNTTKCSYLLNLSGGCLRVNHILFSTFILCMWKYFKIKISNLTIALAVVWLETDYGDIFLPSKTKVKPCCHAVVTEPKMLASVFDSKVQKSHLGIKCKLPHWMSRWIDLFCILERTCNPSAWAPLLNGATKLVELNQAWSENWAPSQRTG